MLIIERKFAVWVCLALVLSAVTRIAMADVLEDIQVAGKIKVGVFSDFPPFSYAGVDFTLQGYDVDVAEFIAQDLGVKVDLVTVTGQNRIPLLNDGRVDILLSVGFSEERAKVIDYTPAYAPYYIVVIGSAHVKIDSVEDLTDKTVAVNRGTLEDTSLTKVASKSVEVLRFDKGQSGFRNVI